MKENKLGKELADQVRKKRKSSLKMGYLALTIFIVSIILIIISPKGFLNPDGYGKWLIVILLLCIWKLYYFRLNWNAVYKTETLQMEHAKYAYLFNSYQHLAVPPKHFPNAKATIKIIGPINANGNWIIEKDWHDEKQPEAGDGMTETVFSISDSELNTLLKK